MCVCVCVCVLLKKFYTPRWQRNWFGHSFPYWKHVCVRVCVQWKVRQRAKMCVCVGMCVSVPFGVFVCLWVCSSLYACKRVCTCLSVCVCVCVLISPRKGSGDQRSLTSGAPGHQGEIRGSRPASVASPWASWSGIRPLPGFQSSAKWGQPELASFPLRCQAWLVRTNLLA